MALNAALSAAYKIAGKDHEKHYVKALLRKSFLDDVRNAINACLMPGWKSRVSAAYVDTHPRATYYDTSGACHKIELADILILRTVYTAPTGQIEKDGRAWLIQAKRTGDQFPKAPPVESLQSEQHYFTSNWPDFELALKRKTGHFSISNSTALEWWGVVWSAVTGKTSPSTYPWSGDHWIASDTDGNSLKGGASPDYDAMGNVLSAFIQGDVLLGSDYALSPLSTGATGGWNELISELIAYCNHGRGDRYETSSFMTYAMLYDYYIGRLYKNYMQEYLASAKYSRSRGLRERLESDESGMLVIEVDLVNLGERKMEYKCKYFPGKVLF